MLWYNAIFYVVTQAWWSLCPESDTTRHWHAFDNTVSGKALWSHVACSSVIKRMVHATFHMVKKWCHGTIAAKHTVPGLGKINYISQWNNGRPNRASRDGLSRDYLPKLSFRRCVCQTVRMIGFASSMYGGYNVLLCTRTSRLPRTGSSTVRAWCR